MVAGASVQAQPPIVVDWIQDQLLWNNSTRGVRIQPTTGRVTMFIGGATEPEDGCSTGVTMIEIAATGEPLTAQFDDPCLEVVGIAQMFCAFEYSPGGVPIIVSLDIGAGWPALWVSGISWEPVSIYSGPGTFSVSDPTRHALLFSGGNFFLGGQNGIIGGPEFDCMDRIWKNAGWSWTTCLDNPFETFDMWNDTLLAIGFPTVTKVDTLNGLQAGTFALFAGTPVTNGHTAISGDTLFWASRFNNGQLHLGRYLIGSGTVWEVTLPFSGYPVELHDDGMGRLWTAAGNRIIWIDQTDGSYQSYSFGSIVNDIDMVGTVVAITGTMDGITSYVLRGHIVP